MTPRERNDLVRSLRNGLAAADREQGDRVAVFAVAAGERLGLSDEQLVDLRLAAELAGVETLPAEPAFEAAKRILSGEDRDVAEILKSALALDQILCGVGSPTPIAVNASFEEAVRAIPLPSAGEVGELANRERGTDSVAPEVVEVTAREGAGWSELLIARGYSQRVVKALVEVQPLIQPLA